jgi:hypothetical protein
MLSGFLLIDKTMLKTDSPKEAILLSKNMPVAYKNYILLNGIVVVAFVEK